MHFTKDELPPVDAFWSVTMYDADGFQVANPINRFAIGDRDALTFNDDGSLDLYVQHEDPGADKESNQANLTGTGAAVTAKPSIRLVSRNRACRPRREVPNITPSR